MVSKQPEHVDIPRSKRYYECLESQRGRERENRARLRLGRCWSGGLPSHSASTVASEAEDELPHAEKVHKKKENAGKKAYRECKKLDAWIAYDARCIIYMPEVYDLYCSFRSPIKTNRQQYIS